MKSIVYFVVQIHVHELIVIRVLGAHCRPENTKQNRTEMHCWRETKFFGDFPQLAGGAGGEPHQVAELERRRVRVSGRSPAPLINAGDA